MWNVKAIVLCQRLQRIVESPTAEAGITDGSIEDRQVASLDPVTNPAGQACFSPLHSLQTIQKKKAMTGKKHNTAS